MEFVFKPEKLSEDLKYQVSETIAKRTENFSRKKLPGLWKKRMNSTEKTFRKKALKGASVCADFMESFLLLSEFSFLFREL